MAITYEEITNNAGLAFAGLSYGAAWGDFNGDNFPDLWVNNHFASNHNLYTNQGNGTFTDVTAQVFLSGELSGDFHGTAWADFDNDGDQDLLQLVGGEGNGTFLPPRSEPNLFYINDGGVLRNQAITLGLSYDSARAQTPLWWDFDNDGLLDLFHGATSRPDGLNPATVFRQTANGFEDVGSTTLPSGIQSQSIVYGILSDLTGDGNLELILPQNRAILDTSSTSFTDITSLLTNPNLLTARDAAAADFNNDLRPDLYLAQGGSDRLLLNSNQGLIDNSNVAGINNSSNSQSVVAGDFDNDMDVDIYVVKSSNTNLPNFLYENQGNGTFITVANTGGAAGSSLGLGDRVVTADYDLDGFLDLFVTNGFGDFATNGPQQLFRNQGNSNNWLEIDLEGVESNRDGIGAQVFLTAGGVTQMREQSGGVHKWSQNHQRIHFGLSDNTLVDLLEIRWPSGAVQQLENFAVNQLLTIIEEDNTSVISGTDGDDFLVGTSSDDTIEGLGGRDTIQGLEGNDSIDGGDGVDTIDYSITPTGVNVNLNTGVITGGAGNDTLTGFEVVLGSAFNDTLTANDSGSQIQGLSGNDSIDGGGGNDFIDGGDVRDTLRGGAGNDSLIGGVGNDSLDGNEGNDSLDGGTDNDTLQGGNGDDTLIGGNGIDRLFETGDANYVLNNTQLTGRGTDSFSGIELLRLVGGGAANSLNASAATFGVILEGASGNDTLAGGAGNDTLIGGVGNDNLSGGGGNDRFTYTAINHRIDTITDFTPGQDTLVFSARSFGGGLTTGTLNATQFVLGSSSGDADDRFIYNDTNGQLFFDADGTGSTNQLLITNLTNLATLSNQNITIVV
jgi:Ca2+-binding RTX toxin-like protein